MNQVVSCFIGFESAQRARQIRIASSMPVFESRRTSFTRVWSITRGSAANHVRKSSSSVLLSNTGPNARPVVLSHIVALYLHVMREMPSQLQHRIV